MYLYACHTISIGLRHVYEVLRQDHEFSEQDWLGDTMGYGRVMLVSRHRYEWLMVYYAWLRLSGILLVAAVT